ncbi:hypothetical protein VP01_3939g1 [Puccinia sorghi]|uniref:Uncharacterized protein n=1 Tax=Puccinia sorghi TaxID=27349 RepID=A0A0L6USG2_9BASI|nr:hypothetical protein VP01_3939g1 [Puccinia sorghi]
MANFLLFEMTTQTSQCFPRLHLNIIKMRSKYEFLTKWPELSPGVYLSISPPSTWGSLYSRSNLTIDLSLHNLGEPEIIIIKAHWTKFDYKKIFFPQVTCVFHFHLYQLFIFVLQLRYSKLIFEPNSTLNHKICKKFKNCSGWAITKYDVISNLVILDLWFYGSQQVFVGIIDFVEITLFHMVKVSNVNRNLSKTSKDDIKLILSLTTSLRYSTLHSFSIKNQAEIESFHKMRQILSAKTNFTPCYKPLQHFSDSFDTRRKYFIFGLTVAKCIMVCVMEEHPSVTTTRSFWLILWYDSAMQHQGFLERSSSPIPPSHCTTSRGPFSALAWQVPLQRCSHRLVLSCIEHWFYQACMYDLKRMGSVLEVIGVFL